MSIDLGHLVWIVWPLLFFGFFWRRGSRRPLARTEKLRRRNRAAPDETLELRDDLDEQRGYVGELERRVAELENRLDFAERLLAAPRERAVTPDS